jgi:hypothetical protein
MSPPGKPDKKKDLIEFGVSPPMLALSKKLASEWGKPETEINREAWERGLRVMVSEDNALAVQRKLKRNPSLVLEAIGRLEADGADPEIVDLLRRSLG